MKRLALCLLLTLPLAAEPLTLEQACKQALDTSPTLKRLESRSQESSHKIEEAQSAGHPRAELDLGYRYVTPELSFGAFPLLVNNNYSAGLVLEQTLHNFGRLKWSTEAARLAQEASLQDIARERERIAFETALSYSRLLTADSATKVSRRRIEARTALVRDLELRVKAGSSANFEKLVADVALAEDEQRLLQAQQRQSTLKDQLLVRLGLPLDSKIELVPLPEIENRAVAGLEAALNDRPEMKAVRLAAEAAKARISYEESGSAPELTAQSRFDVRNATAFQTSNQWSVGIQLRVPLWDGGLSQARTKQAQEALIQLEASQRELERQITLQIREADSHMQLSKQRLELARVQRTRALEAQRVGELRFKAGVGTHQEVLDVQAHASEAIQSLLEAEQAVREAAWELAFSSSQPLQLGRDSRAQNDPNQIP
jgi:outer membrane protein TolC